MAYSRLRTHLVTAAQDQCVVRCSEKPSKPLPGTVTRDRQGTGMTDHRPQGRTALTRYLANAAAAARAEKAEYTQGEDRPLGSFVAITAAYGATVGALALAVRHSGQGLPERFALSDLALIAVATHKLSRRLAKDPVTSPLRAPFTQLDGTSAAAELSEEVRGKGVRKALGELLTCPFCISQWTATGFAFGLVLAPRPTRFAASIFAAVAGSDFLQYAYAMAQQHSQS
jgi:hypothetical protein